MASVWKPEVHYVLWLMVDWRFSTVFQRINTGHIQDKGRRWQYLRFDGAIIDTDIVLPIKGIIRKEGVVTIFAVHSPILLRRELKNPFFIMMAIFFLIWYLLKWKWERGRSVLKDEFQFHTLAHYIIEFSDKRT